jgi:hypothetical protein
LGRKPSAFSTICRAWVRLRRRWPKRPMAAVRRLRHTSAATKH